MLLTIDVGNTNMVFNIYEGRRSIGSFRLSTDANRTSDEIGLTACDYFRRFELPIAEVEDVIIASVVPQVMYSLTSAIIKYMNRTPIIVDEDVDPGLVYSGGGGRLGVDRAVDCIAALKKYDAPLIILDFGTATTLDAVSRSGEYLGGVIMAGMKISMEALFMRAAMLPRVELVKPSHVLGMNTVDQMQAGAVLGYIGSVEYLIRTMKAEMKEEGVRVVATGGLARLIAENTDSIDYLDPQLTPDGLLFLYEKYTQERKGKLTRKRKVHRQFQPAE